MSRRKQKTLFWHKCERFLKNLSKVSSKIVYFCVVDLNYGVLKMKDEEFKKKYLYYIFLILYSNIELQMFQGCQNWSWGCLVQILSHYLEIQVGGQSSCTYKSAQEGPELFFVVFYFKLHKLHKLHTSFTSFKINSSQ
jgi:hypothetical protein